MKKWKLLKSQKVFDTPYISIHKRAYLLPDGTVRDDYYELERPNYVLIVAVDNNKRIAILKQYRRGVDDVIYELPAGWIEKNEIPEEAAKRELKEETGLEMKTCKLLGELYAQPEFSAMKGYVVLIEVDQQTQIQADENIIYEWKTTGDIKEMIKRNEIKDMGAVAALHMYLYE